MARYIVTATLRNRYMEGESIEVPTRWIYAESADEAKKHYEAHCRAQGIDTKHFCFVIEEQISFDD